MNRSLSKRGIESGPDGSSRFIVCSLTTFSLRVIKQEATMKQKRSAHAGVQWLDPEVTVLVSHRQLATQAMVFPVSNLY